MELSVIIPVYNEQDNIIPMLSAVENALTDVEYEIIFVDDGSTDNTVNILLKAANNKPFIKTVLFSRNFGQASAISAGIEQAKGQYIATLDGDLQNDPSDIMPMLAKLKSENLDIVMGVRANRQDNSLSRKLPSKIANFLIRKLTKVNISDYGCTLKLFNSSMAKHLDLYGEMHRFIPILAVMRGAKIAQMPVKHHSRKFGYSKYGLERTLKVISDIMLMAFLLKYRQRPMHFFGGIGITATVTGIIIQTYLLFLKILGASIGTRPLFYVGITLIITGIQLICTGFVSDIIMRTYYGSQNKKPYRVKAVYHGDQKDA